MLGHADDCWCVVCKNIPLYMMSLSGWDALDRVACCPGRLFVALLGEILMGQWTLIWLLSAVPSVSTTLFIIRAICELKSLTKGGKKSVLDQQTLPEMFMQLLEIKNCCSASWRVALIQTVPLYYCGYCILFSFTGTSSTKWEWDQWQFDHFSRDASLLMLTTNHVDIIYKGYHQRWILAPC